MADKEPKKIGRPLLFNSAEELKEKINKYWDSCWDYKRDMFGNRLRDKEMEKNEKGNNKTVKDHGFILVQTKPYTLGGLSVALNCSRETLENYSKKEEFFGTIKEAKDIIYAFAEDSLFVGKNTAGVIFNMKNNYKWKDKHDVEHSGEIKAPVVVSFKDWKSEKEKKEDSDEEKD